jgi:hypothetical protein
MFITVLACVYVIMSMSAKWLGSKGYLKPLYYLWIVMGIQMICYNSILSFQPGNAGCAVMLIPSAWASWSGIVGLKRLRKSCDEETA